MKTVIKIAIVILVSSLWTTISMAEGCQSGYMKDPCPVDGYAMVEIEKFTRDGHNQMYDLHNYGMSTVTKKHKRGSKSRYRSVKQCRYIKVRR